MPETVEDTKYINISSQHGVSRPTSGDYSASYISNMNFPFRGILTQSSDILFSHVDIVSAQIPVSFYNMNHTCNVLKYSIGASAIQTLTLTRSNYSISSLIAELKLQFLIVGYNFTITFSKPTGKLTFSTTSAFSFYYSGSTSFSILGFSSSKNYISTALVLVAEYPATILGIKRLKFSSSALATSSIGSFSGGASACFGTVPVNASVFGLIQYDNTSGRRSLLKNTLIDEIDIQVFDENNRFIDFNNVDWSLTLAITTTRLFANPDGKVFSDSTHAILQNLDKETKPSEPNNVAPIQPFGDDTDLDFFMYKQGIDI